MTSANNAPIIAWPPEALRQMGEISDGLRAGGPDAVAPVLLEMLLGRPAHYGQWLAKWQAQPQERLAEAVQVLMGVDDISGRLAEISAPTLVVHGEADRPIPLPLGAMLRDRIPGAQQFVTVPGAGHTPSLTHPRQVNAALAEFLRNFARPGEASVYPRSTR